MTLMSGCASSERTFDGDVAFLREHTDVVVLATAESGARVAVVPAWQGRVVTSSATGDGGTSYGWINDELVASGEFREHINVFGGEDRFWLGPEGGQYSIFFEAGSPFDLEHWHTPAVIDTVPWAVADRSATRTASSAHVPTRTSW